jgi:predicted nucleic acid-binding protein
VAVVDTSAVIAALVGDPPNRVLLERLGSAELHAPHLVDVEVLHVLRTLVARRGLSVDRAAEARREYGEWTLVRYPHEHLLDRMWALRQNLSAYDAAFVALSEALGLPLVTIDTKLARAAGNVTTVELY